MTKKKGDPFEVGDRVVVEGMHTNWMPYINEIKQGEDGKLIAVLQTAVTGGIYEHPLSKCKHAPDPKKKRGTR